MPRYVIERTLPGAGQLDDQQLHDISAKSNEVLDSMPDVTWVESYVSDDKLFCVYDSPDADSIREHAEQGGFPCDAVNEVRHTISPATGR
ncbi:DUF4242 domain-containing protein [Rudaeicoccus suwonensis]|uniref:Uncharacterized protein DUF4242 n=1 Tax=Rudaeicoccus suwonensis TaxID=657409 RepID=A0A561E8L2_9MICO|nr:DUF4242 domain-containing protein [Rudaeicoccus suwonensis]TWE11936.1 uncharacterized protein DUF4242 [Rudaeicoccus suwonensis]